MTGVLVCEDADDMRAMLQPDVVLSGFGPEPLGDRGDTVDAHLPKTADLATVRRTLLEVAAERPQDR